MQQEKLKLNWRTYTDHLRGMLHEMMKSNELTDVTLVCDDKRKFKAHKIVLSACSSVFKSIVNDLPQNSSVIYLKGIKHQEMESILEFMYLGVATFYQERLNEFLNVANNLEIKEISNIVEFHDKNVSNEEPEYPENEEATEDVELQTNSESERNASSVKSVKIMDPSQIKRTSEGNFHCDHCERKFTTKSNLTRHIQSIHEGVMYPCNQCDFKGTLKNTLTLHIKSKHEGVMYGCSQCDYEASNQSNLTVHIKSKHEGVKYACNQCDYQATEKGKLRVHIQSKHEGMKYSCIHCDKQYYDSSTLRRHFNSKHA